MSGPSRDELDVRSWLDRFHQAVVSCSDGCVVRANASFATLCGRGDAVIGWKLDDLFADRGQGVPRRAGPDSVACALIRPGGESREVVCRRISLVCSDDRSGSAEVWSVEDRTHVRSLERELLLLGRELAAANRERAELQEQLRAERDEREDLLSMVSHELRTPVTVVGGYNRLLLSGDVGPLTQDQRRFLEESQKSCERLDGFIGNLIDASRVDKGAHVLELTRAPLGPVCESVRDMLREPLELQSMELEIDIRCTRKARFDRLRVEQVLLNLVGNAIKYGGRGSCIEIRVEAATSGDCLRVSVNDSGPGIPPAWRERIFEPYVQRGDEAQADGLGLGLAISRRIVEAHGGVISVTARPEGGSTFVFTLPIADAPRATAAGEA